MLLSLASIIVLNISRIFLSLTLEVICEAIFSCESSLLPASICFGASILLRFLVFAVVDAAVTIGVKRFVKLGSGDVSR